VRKNFGALGAALVAALLVSACGDKGGGGGGLFGGGGVAGSYELDVDAAKKAAEEATKKQMPEGLPPEAMEQARKMMDQMLNSMKMDFDVKADGTFAASMSMEMMGQKKDSSAKGTWKQSGDQVTFTTTEEDGKAKSPPDVKTATYKDGRLTVTEGPMTIVLKKK
jgi:hypothetical protein